MSESTNIDSDHQAAEIARGVGADGEGAGLSQLIQRFRANQEAATRDGERLIPHLNREAAKQRAWVWKVAADHCQVLLDHLVATVPRG